MNFINRLYTIQSKKNKIYRKFEKKTLKNLNETCINFILKINDSKKLQFQ